MEKLKFILDDYNDILNLHKGLLEARFHDNPLNYHVAGSPVLSKIHIELIELLKKIELNKNGKEGWSNWTLLKNQSYYKNQVVVALKRDSNWSGYDMERKIQVVKNHIAPFVCEDIDIMLIIEAIGKTY